ncbi:OmpA family protein [Sulfurospirillum arcachonense]|uniref:OmpA family protein n=1 Tax=Sulfurospirillum arcachonense TaxID=57666 RepID=UPI000467EE72|nr:OmpA family protein [Sulfurospirillum arcachonense]
MILHVLFRCKIFYKNFIFVLLLSTNLFAFNNIMEDVFLKNKDLIHYKKDLQNLNSLNKKNPLESALSNGFNQKEQLKTLIFKKKNDLTLKIITLYLRIEKDNEILNIYKQDYAKYLKNRENDNLLKIVKKRLEKQKNSLTKSLNKFENFTKNYYKKINLQENIKKFDFPLSSNHAYSKFLLLQKYKQKAIFLAINTDKKSKLLHLLNQHYTQHNFMLNDIKSKKEELEKSLQNSKQKNTLLKSDIINIKYNILLNKCKVSYILGTLTNNIKTVFNKTKISKIKLKRIHFSRYSTTVSSYSIIIVRNHAKKLRNLDHYILELHGYSDSNGNKKVNYKLSLERVINTKKELIKLGINKNKIKIFAHGELKPIVSNKTKKGRLLNRRVEFKLYKDN